MSLWLKRVKCAEEIRIFQSVKGMLIFLYRLPLHTCLYIICVNMCIEFVIDERKIYYNSLCPVVRFDRLLFVAQRILVLGSPANKIHNNIYQLDMKIQGIA